MAKHYAEGISRIQHITPPHFSRLTTAPQWKLQISNYKFQMLNLSCLKFEIFNLVLPSRSNGLYSLCGTGPLLLLPVKGWVLPTTIFMVFGLSSPHFLCFMNISATKHSNLITQP